MVGQKKSHPSLKLKKCVSSELENWKDLTACDFIFSRKAVRGHETHHLLICLVELYVSLCVLAAPRPESSVILQRWPRHICQAVGVLCALSNSGAFGRISPLPMILWLSCETNSDIELFLNPLW